MKGRLRSYIVSEYWGLMRLLLFIYFINVIELIFVVRHEYKYAKWNCIVFLFYRVVIIPNCVYLTIVLVPLFSSMDTVIFTQTVFWTFQKY